MEKNDKTNYESPTIGIYSIRIERIVCASPGDDVYNGDTDPAIII